MSALDQNHAIGVRAAVADHLGRAPTRAELIAAPTSGPQSRRARSCPRTARARGGCGRRCRRSHLSGAGEAECDHERHSAGRTGRCRKRCGRSEESAQPRPDGSEPQTFTPEFSCWCPINPGGEVGQHIGSRRCCLPRRCTRKASQALAEPRSTYQARDLLSGCASGLLMPHSRANGWLLPCWRLTAYQGLSGARRSPRAMRIRGPSCGLSARNERGGPNSKRLRMLPEILTGRPPLQKRDRPVIVMRRRPRSSARGLHTRRRGEE
jgi:hypothetical protein